MLPKKASGVCVYLIQLKQVYEIDILRGLLSLGSRRDCREEMPK